jgi:hypothetical protein
MNTIDLLQDSSKVIHAPDGNGLIVPLGIIASIVSALAGAIAFVFMLYRKANSDLISEKEKRHEDALEYERTLSALKERLASRRNGHGTERSEA